MPPRSPAFRMADRLTQGRLAELIREGRAADESWDRIARKLDSDFGIDVTSETLRLWFLQMEEEEGAA